VAPTVSTTSTLIPFYSEMSFFEISKLPSAPRVKATISKLNLSIILFIRILLFPSNPKIFPTIGSSSSLSFKIVA